MKELVKIEENDGKQLVSARELHLFLESPERFSRWFERMVEYGEFEKDLDYTSVQKCTVVGQGAEKEIGDYAMTVDMAKEVSMLQRSDKGKQARRYFIQCETSLRDIYNKVKAIDTQIKAEELLSKKLENIQTMQKCQLLFGDMLIDTAINACKECGIDPDKYKLSLTDRPAMLKLVDNDPYLIDRYLLEHPITEIILSRLLFANYLNWFTANKASKGRCVITHQMFNWEMENRNYDYRKRSIGWVFIPKL